MMSNKTLPVYGFTLLEVMISLIIFSLIAVTAAKYTPLQTLYIYNISKKSQAILIAQNQMDLFRYNAKSLTTHTLVSNIEQFGEQWIVKSSLENTRNEKLFKLEINIFQPRAPERSLYTLITFLGENLVCCNKEG